MLPKKCRMRRMVSVAVFSLPSESTSMQEPGFSSALRKGMASMYPVEGKFSSNIITRRISSVSFSRRPMTEASVENSSPATFSAA